MGIGEQYEFEKTGRIDPEPSLGKFGHHPDPAIDAEVEIDRLKGLLSEAHGGLLRALDFSGASAESIRIKQDVRYTLRQTGFTGSMGERGQQSMTSKIVVNDIDTITGLTEDENECHKSLMDACGKFCSLPQQHPDELREFIDCIHRIQNLLTIRIARRHYPKGWPVVSIPEYGII